ncbi:hypothetical protein [Nocardia thailandica]|uniref:hypothetical protein n=1 Tax=Nocardia thailandica TaxID=257275 RepID=UPI0002D47B5C|nr:hypothetical protein [Nocardia thailandica]
MSYFDAPEREAAEAALALQSAQFSLLDAELRLARAQRALAEAQAAAEAEIDQLNKELTES